MSKRILWLTENYPPQRGGMAQSCDRIIDGLRSKGYFIEVIHFCTHDEKAIKKKQFNGSYTSFGFYESEPHTLNLLWNYLQQFDEFDYITCFGGHLSLLSAPIFAKWMDIKLLVFLRGNDFDSSIFTLRKREVLEYALKNANIVFSVSQEKCAKVKKWLPDVNAHYVPNGIGTTDWQPMKSEIAFATQWREENCINKVCFGLIGSLKSKKGLNFLLNTLYRTNLKDQIHFLLIGDISEKDQDLLQHYHLSHSILSFKDRFELMKYYLCCDAIIIPSFYDGMPNVMLEAGLLELAIIGSKVDGMSDLIDHQHDGLLFEAGNEDELKKVIYDFFALNTIDRKALGQRLKTKILSHYTAQHETAHYHTFLQ